MVQGASQVTEYEKGAAMWAALIQVLFRQAKRDGVTFYTPDYGDGEVHWYRGAESGEIDVRMREFE